MKGAEKGKGFFHTKYNCQMHSEMSALAMHMLCPRGQEGDFRQVKMLQSPTILFPCKSCSVWLMMLQTWGRFLLLTPVADHQPGESCWFGFKNMNISSVFGSLSCRVLCFPPPPPPPGNGKRARAPGDRVQGLCSTQMPSATAFHEY